MLELVDLEARMSRTGSSGFSDGHDRFASCMEGSTVAPTDCVKVEVGIFCSSASFFNIISSLKEDVGNFLHCSL